MAESEKGTLSWTNRRGKLETREVNLAIDIQKFKGTAGYVWLVIAANPHLSVSEIQDWLDGEDPGSYRPKTFITKRRWMFHPKFKPGGRANADGKDAAARRIMTTNPGSSLRELSKHLAEHGINRSKDWIRLHRCDCLSVS